MSLLYLQHSESTQSGISNRRTGNRKSRHLFLKIKLLLSGNKMCEMSNVAPVLYREMTSATASNEVVFGES